MKTTDVKNIKISKKYSNALLETAQNENKTDIIYNDLIFIVETINTNKHFADFLLSPVINAEDKKEVIAKIFSVHVEKITLDFLYLLTDHNRLNVLNEILNQFSYSYNELNNIVKPIIISAVELNSEQKNKIEKKLQKKLYKKISPEYLIDSGIIGGLIIEIGDKTIDCSLKTKFDNMKKQLTKGNKYGSN